MPCKGTMREESDERLVERAGGGEIEAFEELYYRYRGWVYALARRFTGDDELAADATQEVFIYLLGKFPGFQLTSRMTTFLYPTTKHIALTIKRNRGEAVSVEQAGVEPEAKESTEEDKQRAELADAMASLTEEHREVVLMRFVDGMTVEEVARALGVAQGTVKSRLSRAMETLRNDPRARRYFTE